MNLSDSTLIAAIFLLIGVVVTALPSFCQSVARYRAAMADNPEAPATLTGRFRAWYRQGWLAEWLQDFSSELAGAVVTSIILVSIFNNIQATQARFDQLLADFRSSDNEIALEVLEELREDGQLTDGSLHDVSLRRANLANADLAGASLQGVNFLRAILTGANLQAANLESANLQLADLTGADLRDANLTNVELTGAILERVQLENTLLIGINFQGVRISGNLRGADLTGANLRDADLRDIDLSQAILVDADLRGAILIRANLSGASTERALFDETTILPDGSNWTTETQISEFTE